MEVEFSLEFRKKYHKANVRIRYEVDDCLQIFRNNPKDPQLDSHTLRGKYTGYRSIDITNDYRALHQEKLEGKDLVAFFTTLGTHKELYK